MRLLNSKTSRLTCLLLLVLSAPVFAEYPKVLFEDKTAAYICDPCDGTVSPQIIERGKGFKRRIFQIAPDAYVALGYVGSSLMVVGNEGAVVVGTPNHFEDSSLIAERFLTLRNHKPIKAVVYSDSLKDVFGGVEAFITKKQAEDGSVSVIAHESFFESLKGISDIGNFLNWRLAYQTGSFLERGPKGRVHMGATAYNPGRSTYIAPTLLVGEKWQGTPGGVKTRIYHFPTETDDTIATYFPDQKILTFGHMISGNFLPQIYSPRGENRNAERWYKSLDDLITMVENNEVEYMVPMHFYEPVVGKANIIQVLTDYRDVLQYINDQSARYINKGYGPDELAEIKLPPSLASKPYMQEHYGALQQHMRQQYYDRLGWFEGDPTFLDPLSKQDRASFYIDALGGRSALLQKAEIAQAQDKLLWAAELLSWLIVQNPKDMEARTMKADILRQLGYRATNAAYRNWYLTSALELENKLPQNLVGTALIPPEILGTLTPLELLETLKPRLKAEQTFAHKYTITLCFTDSAQCVAAIIRQGILQTKNSALPQADVSARMTVKTFKDLVSREKTLDMVLTSGEVQINQGEKSILFQMQSLFEPVVSGNYPVALPATHKINASGDGL